MDGVQTVKGRVDSNSPLMAYTAGGQGASHKDRQCWRGIAQGWRRQWVISEENHDSVFQVS